MLQCLLSNTTLEVRKPKCRKKLIFSKGIVSTQGADRSGMNFKGYFGQATRDLRVENKQHNRDTTERRRIRRRSQLHQKARATTKKPQSERHSSSGEAHLIANLDKTGK